jgi:hypothetical protein
MSLLFFSLHGETQVMFTRYIRTLYYAGLVLGVIGLVLTVQSKELQDTGYLLQLYNREKDALLVGINDKIMSYYPQSERLYLELNAFNPVMKQLQKTTNAETSGHETSGNETSGHDTAHQLIVENVLASSIYRRMEELLLVQHVTNESVERVQDKVPFLDKTLQRIFCQWSKGPIMSKFWQENKMQFSSMLRLYIQNQKC